ncbi:MAG: hypothetical protein LBG80_04890 [Bacteroidales bacterium]|jgi:hypothetical protein|nr:hypothetical protein [Bacteroidales bacterium]
MNIIIQSSEKYILAVLLILLTATYSNAQNIKTQAEQKKRQEQYEREQQENELKEAARTKKAQLNLNDLLKLLSKDLDYVDEYLTERHWELSATNIEKDRKEVIWSFDKDPNNDDMARGWFHFLLHPDYDNAIVYSTADETHLNKLKSELISSGYKRIYPTDIIKRGLESVYRNSLYEVNFRKQLKSDPNAKEANIHYSFYIYNYKEVEARLAEEARLAAEEQARLQEEAEREKKYQDAIKNAENAYSKKQYSQSKQAYSEALWLKPEEGKRLSDKIADIDINILCEEADRLFKTNQYEKAKEKYAIALEIRPNNKTTFINGKIKEIADFQQFLIERTYEKYDYKTLESADYNAKDDYIESELKKYLLANAEILAKTTVSIACEIDTLGDIVDIVSNYTTSIQNKNLNTLLDKLSSSIKLEPCFINGYPVSAKAEFNYTVEYNHFVIVVKKKPEHIFSKNKNFNTYYTDIDSMLASAPYGKYTFDMNKIVINGQHYDNDKLIKTSTHGASNAFLSLLIPGLGQHRVSFGKRKGLGITIPTYMLIGSGIGLKFYSNSEYKKYNDATTQEEMDDHYINANFSNYAFYTFIIAGGIIWLSDIIWVASKGAKNKKNMKAYEVYKKQYLGFYYHPQLHVSGLTYTVNF